MRHLLAFLLAATLPVHATNVRIEGGNGQIAVTRDGETTIATYDEQESTRVVVRDPLPSGVTYTDTRPRQWLERQIDAIYRLEYLAWTRYGHPYADGYGYGYSAYPYGGYAHRWDRPSRFCDHHPSWRVHHVAERFRRW